MKYLVTFLSAIIFSQVQCFPMDSFTSLEGKSYWNSELANFPEAAPYIQKIDARLDELFLRPDNEYIKQRTISFVNKQLSHCKSPFTGVLDQHCVGRLTGLTLGLIKSLEATNDSTRLTPYWDPEIEFSWKFQRQ